MDTPDSRVPAYVLTLAVALQLAAASWWLDIDTCLSNAPVDHQLMAREIANGWASGQRSVVDWLLAHRTSGYQSTAWHVALAPLIAAAPAERGPDLLAWLTAVCALPMLSIAVFLLGSKRAGPRAGALAGVAVLLIPAIWGYARHFTLELLLCALVAAYAAAIDRKDPWGRPQRGAAFGFAGGLCCLVQPLFLFWLPGLLLPSFLEREERLDPRAVAAFVCGLVVGSAYYWTGALANAAVWSATLQANFDAFGQPLGLDGIWFYPLSIVSWLGPGLCLFALFGLGVEDTKPQRLLCSWIVGGLLAFTLWPIKSAIAMLPALPPLMILGAQGIARCKGEVLQAVLIFTLGAALGQAWYGSAVSSVTPPEACHPPDTLDWRPALAEGAQAVRDILPLDRQPKLIAIDGPRGWPGDSYSVVHLHLIEAFPGAEVQRRSIARGAADLVLYQAIQPRLEMRVHIGEAGETSPPVRQLGWRRLGPWTLRAHTDRQKLRQVWIDLAPSLFHR